MALPTYDKSKRRKTFEQLPKSAYVVRILNAKERPWNSGSGSSIEMAFDIAEGEYTGFYKKQFEKNDSEDKKWPNDAVFRLSVPQAGSESYVWSNWNSFFADLEDSNNGFVFAGDVAALKNKIIGGKFHIEQSEYNGNVYDHTRMKWTCVAEDVRQGKAGKLPADKLLADAKGGRKTASNTNPDDFMNVPDDADEEIPF